MSKGKIRGSSAEKIVHAEERARMFRQKLELKQANEDTNIRTAIQAVISQGIDLGNSKEEIIAKLNENERFSKYQMFFDSWTQHQIDKNVIQKQKQKDNEKEM